MIKQCVRCKYSSKIVLPINRETQLKEKKSWKCQKGLPHIKNPYGLNDCSCFEEKTFRV